MSNEMDVNKSGEKLQLNNEEHKPELDKYNVQEYDSEFEFIKNLSKSLLSSSPNKYLAKRHPYEGMFEDFEELERIEENLNNVMSSDDDELFFSVILEDKNIVEMPDDLELESFMLESSI